MWASDVSAEVQVSAQHLLYLMLIDTHALGCSEEVPLLLVMHGELRGC